MVAENKYTCYLFFTRNIHKLFNQQHWGFEKEIKTKTWKSLWQFFCSYNAAKNLTRDFEKSPDSKLGSRRPGLLGNEPLEHFPLRFGQPLQRALVPLFVSSAGISLIQERIRLFSVDQHVWGWKKNKLNKQTNKLTWQNYLRFFFQVSKTQ